MTLQRYKGESTVQVLLWELNELADRAKELETAAHTGSSTVDDIQSALNNVNLQVQKVNLKLLIALSRVKK